MADFDWKAVVRTVAPGIATALGGPLAGMAVKALGDAIGMDSATEESVAAAIKGATPEDLLKVKQAEQEFQVKMRSLDIDLVKIAAGDRDSARQREVQTKDEMPKILASIIVTAWCFIQWHLINHSIPDDMRELVMRVLGTLDAALLTVLYYYFGSSAQPTPSGGERRARP